MSIYIYICALDGILFGLPHHLKTPQKKKHLITSLVRTPPPCGSISNLPDFPNPQKKEKRKKKVHTVQDFSVLLCSDFSNSRRNYG